MPRPKKSQDQPPISVVGIGASAGGIEALQALFKALPDDLGHAYVVIVHLAPDHASNLSSILGRCTRMPVAEVREIMDLKPDHVYVIPPNRSLEITDSSVGAQEFDRPHGQRNAIDIFFRSLAAKHGDGFAVILSGGGSDGAIGAKAVKEAGGVILVQDPEEAAHDSMPRAVIDADIADVVAGVETLARHLAEITRSKRTLAPILNRPGDELRLNEEDESNFSQIIDLLRSRTSHDFSQYKRTTVLRRMARRMQLARTETFSDYLSHLRENKDEIFRLMDDVLITVTGFFRDPDAWDVLRKQVIAPLVQAAHRDTTLRAWVVGCATGEEAYSLAILLQEEMNRQEKSCELIIFASDIDQDSLVAARKGRYPAAIAVDVSEERLNRFFRHRGDHYEITDGIRNCVVFARHSVFRDPPFSRINLLTCRNLLIYLERELQEELQSIFRYACRDDGYLFLGSAEAVQSKLFQPVDKHHRIYRMGQRPVEFPNLRGSGLLKLPKKEEEHVPSAAPVHNLAECHLQLIEELAPPSLLIDDKRRVVHLSPSAGRYLQPRGGEPGIAVDDLLRKELRNPALNSVERAFATGGPAASPPVAVRFNGEPRWVTLLVHVRPATDSAPPVALMMFLESEELSAGEQDADVADTKSGLVRELRQQLRSAGTRIDRREAEHDVTLQDLRAANEELQSLNEDYRSTAEELETSKEELQSVNEELQTVNTQLSLKLEETSQARSDLENLLVATNVATLFLDRDMCIKRFTPALAEIFHIRHSDVGRPISDLTHVLEKNDLAELARKVLSNLAPVEYEAGTQSGATLMVRISPYRTTDDRIEGVVMSFVDITRAKESEELRQSRKQLEAELHVTKRLHAMWMAVTTAASGPVALDEILETAVDLLEGDFGTIEVFDPEAQRMRIAAQHGIRKNLLAALEEVVASEGSATRRAVATRRQAQIADVMEDDDYAPHREFAAKLGYRTVQATPLRHPDGTVIGVLSTMYRQPDGMTARHRELAELLASQASTLIVNREQQRQLEKLYKDLKDHTRTIEANDQQLRKQTQELLNHDRAKEEFLNLLGHELRNPLAAIRNSLEALEREGGPEWAEGDNFRERALRIIDRQSRHMTRMVNDLLEISRINQGKLNLRLQSTDIRDTVSDAVTTLEHEFSKQGIDLQIEMPDEPVYVRADPERAAQVLDNLLRNAYQFTEAGGEVKVTLVCEDAHACIRVADTGIGMEPDQIESLFQPYRQAADGLRLSHGLGLGLSLCRKLMNLHAGEITAHSDGPEKGSEFVLRFPLTKSKPVVESASQDALKQLRVLVVDDDLDNATSLGVLLESLGQQTRIVHDGAEALAAAKDFKPNMVFLDVSMPGMSGFEVARALHGGEFSDQPMTLVGLSGHPPKEGSKEFDRYVIKPATLDDIIDSLNSTPAD